MAGPLGELRHALGLPREPRIAVVTASGNIDPGHPVLERDSLIMTAPAAAAELRHRLPSTCTVTALPALTGAAITANLRDHGLRAILCEGGPHLYGTLADDAALHELFLTVSPVLAGRRDGDHRLGLVHGTHLLPDRSTPAELVSVRRSGAHLFVRYDLAAKRG
jgi:riboflavin biosynthesis pyrimidine reductase